MGACASTGGGSEPPESGIYGLDCPPGDAAVVLVPVPWEPTVSKGRGTAAAPSAIVQASRQVDLFDIELGEVAAAGIAMLPVDGAIEAAGCEAAALARPLIEGFDAGRAPLAGEPALGQIDALCRQMVQWVAAQVRHWLDAGKLVGVVGGEHSVALGSIAAQVAHGGPMGVLQIDAHADLRVAYQGMAGSHASVMHRVLSEQADVHKLVSVGLRDLCPQEYEAIRAAPDRIAAFFDADLAAAAMDARPFSTIARQIAEQLPERVYLSLDVDGLDPALCPHTGTPVPGGLRFAELGALLGAVVHSGRRIVGFDLCEVVPGPDPDDDWDANVGARLLYRMIGYALGSRA